MLFGAVDAGVVEVAVLVTVGVALGAVGLVSLLAPGAITGSVGAGVVCVVALLVVVVSVAGVLFTVGVFCAVVAVLLDCFWSHPTKPKRQILVSIAVIIFCMAGYLL